MDSLAFAAHIPPFAEVVSAFATYIQAFAEIVSLFSLNINQKPLQSSSHTIKYATSVPPSWQVACVNEQRSSKPDERCLLLYLWYAHL
jgi:uncharacterized membrane protein